VKIDIHMVMIENSPYEVQGLYGQFLL
jgi:hypothetical protein